MNYLPNTERSTRHLNESMSTEQKVLPATLALISNNRCNITAICRQLKLGLFVNKTDQQTLINGQIKTNFLHVRASGKIKTITNHKFTRIYILCCNHSSPLNHMLITRKRSIGISKNHSQQIAPSELLTLNKNKLQFYYTIILK